MESGRPMIFLNAIFTPVRNQTVLRFGAPPIKHWSGFTPKSIKKLKAMKLCRSKMINATSRITHNLYAIGDVCKTVCLFTLHVIWHSIMEHYNSSIEIAILEMSLPPHQLFYHTIQLSTTGLTSQPKSTNLDGNTVFTTLV